MNNDTKLAAVVVALVIAVVCAIGQFFKGAPNPDNIPWQFTVSKSPPAESGGSVQEVTEREADTSLTAAQLEIFRVKERPVFLAPSAVDRPPAAKFNPALSKPVVQPPLPMAKP